MCINCDNFPSSVQLRIVKVGYRSDSQLQTTSFPRPDDNLPKTARIFDQNNSKTINLVFIAAST